MLGAAPRGMLRMGCQPAVDTTDLWSGSPIRSTPSVSAACCCRWFTRSAAHALPVFRDSTGDLQALGLSATVIRRLGVLELAAGAMRAPAVYAFRWQGLSAGVRFQLS